MNAAHVDRYFLFKFFRGYAAVDWGVGFIVSQIVLPRECFSLSLTIFISWSSSENEKCLFCPQDNH